MIKLTTTHGLALLIATTSTFALAQAQGPDRKGGEPSEGRRMEAGENQGSPRQGSQRGEKSESRGTGDKSGSRSGGDRSSQREEGASRKEERATDTKRDTERRDRDTERSAKSKNDSPDRSKSRSSSKEAEKDDEAGRADKQSGRAEERMTGEGKDDSDQRAKSRSASEKQEKSDKAAKGAGPERAKDASAGKDEAEPKEARERRRESRDDIREVRRTVTSEKHTQVRDVFLKDVDRDRVRADVDVRVRIGVALPRRVVLHEVPASVVEIIPAYRRYRYVVVRDEICIVDPETHVIIDVIGREPTRRIAGRQSLQGPERFVLTREEENIVLDHVDSDRYEAAVDLELDVGINLPRSARVHAFPDVVVDKLPKVKPYRFTVIDDDVAIVDAEKLEVVYVIDQ